VNPAAPSKILIAREPGETRFALKAGDDVLEVALVRDIDVQPGATYIGRAGARIGDACLIDLGHGAPAFLQSKRLPAEGQWVQVMVVAAARGGKGPTVKRVTLSGVVEGPAREIVPGPTPAATWLARHDADAIAVIVGSADATQHAGLSPGQSFEGYRDRTDLFDAEGINDAIEEAIAPTIPLPGGGSVMFDATAAAWMIDINAGGLSIADANRLGIAVIARHLRLRNLSGHILIDLISTRGRAQFKEQLARLTAADPFPAQIVGFTPLGMLELTRPRIRASLPELMLDGQAPSARTVAYRALARVIREVEARPAVAITLIVAPIVAGILQGELRAATEGTAQQSRARIAIAAKDAFAPDRFEIAPAS